MGDLTLCLSGWRASTSRTTSPRPGWSSWQPSPPTLTSTWPRWDIIMWLPGKPCPINPSTHNQDHPTVATLTINWFGILTPRQHALLTILSTKNYKEDKIVWFVLFQTFPWVYYICSLPQMPGNCRNISDEVFPGIHVGDKWVNILKSVRSTKPKTWQFFPSCAN